MGKFDGVLLASDFDDTLYGLDRQVCPRNRKALDYFIAQGGRFTVATGRAHTTFAPYVHLAPINAPVVLSNGSAIYDFQQERFLVQTLLDPRAPDDMAALTAAIPEIGFEAYHGEDIYVYNFNAVTAGHMKKVGTTYTQCPIAQMPTPWGKVILQQEHDVLLLQNHGALTVGADLLTAYYRMETLELYAKISLTAHLLGGAKEIPKNQIDKLMDLRKNYYKVTGRHPGYKKYPPKED